MAAWSHFPPGWDEQRWLNATDGDFDSITDEQMAAAHTGIYAELGEEGHDEFFGDLERRRLAKAYGKSRPLGPPNWLMALQMNRMQDGEWGYVMFRTFGGSDSGGGEVAAVKARIEESLHGEMAEDGDSEEVASAREKFRLIWVEGRELDGASAQEVAKRYREMDKPYGFDHSLCLCVDEASFKSVQLGEAKRMHVLAVSTETGLGPFGRGPDDELNCDVSMRTGLEIYQGEENDDERWEGTFKFALEYLIGELFSSIGGGSLSPFEVGVGVTRDLVRVGMARQGGKRKAAYM